MRTVGSGGKWRKGWLLPGHGIVRASVGVCVSWCVASRWLRYLQCVRWSVRVSLTAGGGDVTHAMRDPSIVRSLRHVTPEGERTVIGLTSGGEAA